MIKIFFILIFLSFESFAIVGGKLVSRGAILSSTVSLVAKNKSFCTGTLITKRHVITAAHCVQSSRPFQIGFGADISVMRKIEVESVKSHENFNPRMMNNNPSSAPNDLALVKLREAAPPGFLPVKIYDNSLFHEDRLILAGFGLTGFFKKKLGTLRYVETIFNETLVDVKEFSFGSTPGRSACKGDSGGPAYYLDKDGALFLVGATSRGARGKKDRFGRDVGCSGAGFYTDIREFRNWIKVNL